MQYNLRQAQVIHRKFCFTLLKNCLKCIKKQQMHFGFMDVILLHHTEVRQWLLSFDTESFVFQVANQKYRD
jgi:hypothetical protein